MTSFTAKELKAYAKAGAVAEEVLGAIRTVVAFGGQSKEVDRYTVNLADAKSFGQRKGLMGAVGMAIVFFIIFAVYALAFWYGAKLIREEPENYDVGNLLIVSNTTGLVLRFICLCITSASNICMAPIK